LAAAERSGQPILILKEGTSRAQGREAQHANIIAARIISESIKSSLGPKGMDKMLVDSFGDVTITNDGATVLDEMEVQHPAAKMLVEVAKAQDDEVGDGTTSVVVLAGELLAKAESLIEKGVHPTVIVEGFREAMEKSTEVLERIAVKVKNPLDKATLKKVAKLSMASKLVAENRDFLADMAVKAIIAVSEKTEKGYKVDLDDAKVEKKPGESIVDSTLIQGVLLDKEVVHPGMPRRVENAKIALVNAPLEVEKTEFDAKLNIETPEQMKAFLDEEENILRNMVDTIVKAGANVVIAEKGIDDIAQHFLAKANVLAVRRAKQSDMEKLAKATGGRIITNLDDVKGQDLGAAKLVEERKLGDDKMVFVEGCRNPKSVTILMRGGTERIVDEAERAMHDALSVVRDVVIDPRIVAGGGATESEIARHLRNHAEKMSGREQLAVQAFAEAIETIPETLAQNAGMDSVDVTVRLRSKHERGGKWVGVDPLKGKIVDFAKSEVWEPLAVKLQMVKSAGEAAAMLLKIDDVIAATKRDEGAAKGPEDGGKEESESES
jgi:thermosome